MDKSVVQARMLSGRYWSLQLRCHWTQNRLGICEVEPCHSLEIPGSLSHQLLDSEALSNSRRAVLNLWQRQFEFSPFILKNFKKYTVDHPELSLQLILDPSVLPELIELLQQKDEESLNTIIQLTHTFCFSLYKAKLQLLGIR